MLSARSGNFAGAEIDGGAKRSPFVRRLLRSRLGSLPFGAAVRV
jgi:hypothetical protein